MRTIVNSTYISLDGVVEEPHRWPTIERPSDDRSYDLQWQLLEASDAVLMGRRTYEGFAPVWQTRSGDPYSDRINSMPKYVVSTTLERPEWANTTVISTDVAERIRDLKAEPGGGIVQYGFGPVTTLLLEHGLLDELRLWVHPLFVGTGTADDLLFPKALTTQFELADATTLADGIAILSYRIA